MRDLCRAAADPLIHQDAVTFSLSGRFFWGPMRDREDTSASGEQEPIIRRVTDHFNLIPVYQLSVIFLNYWCACRKRIKEIRRFAVPLPPGALLCTSFPWQSESNLPDVLMFVCVLVGRFDFWGCSRGEESVWPKPRSWTTLWHIHLCFNGFSPSTPCIMKLGQMLPQASHSDALSDFLPPFIQEQTIQ